MTESEMRLHRCCFTGHRPQKLRRSEKEIKDDLESAIQQAITDGYTTFITGMAYGVDIWAGQIVVRLRKHNPALHLIAAVPFRGFEDRWSTDWKRAYQELLEQADLVKYICPGYNAGAYQRRNEWMVDHSSRVIAVFNGEPSGTKNTVDYAKKCACNITDIQGQAIKHEFFLHIFADYIANVKFLKYSKAICCKLHEGRNAEWAFHIKSCLNFL